MEDDFVIVYDENEDEMIQSESKQLDEEEIQRIRQNEERLELFRKYMFSSQPQDSQAQSPFNLLESIIHIISNNESDELRVRKPDENNDTLDSSKPISSIPSNDGSEANSHNTSVVIGAVGDNASKSEIINTESEAKSRFYRGIPISGTVRKEDEYENDDSYVEEDN